MSTSQRLQPQGDCRVERIVKYEKFVRLYVREIDSLGHVWRLDLHPTNRRLRYHDIVRWKDLDVLWTSVLRGKKASGSNALRMFKVARKVSSHRFDHNNIDATE